MNAGVPIVLLIEHDPIQSMTLVRAMKGGGYSVIPARRAHDALETFVTHHMDIALVVADTRCATFAGPPLLGALNMIDPRVPVVVMSSGAPIEPGADEYPNVVATLTKPIAPADLLAHMQRALQSPVAQDEHFSRAARGAVVDPRWVAGPVPALGEQAFGYGGVPFSWPPAEDDLDDIQVVDTQATHAPGALRPSKRVLPPPPDRRLSLAARAAPQSTSPAQVTPTAEVAPPAVVTPSAKVIPPAVVTPPARIIPPAVVAPPVQVNAPAQFVSPMRLVRRSEPRRRRLGFMRTDRWIAVAATALGGLTLTTLLEVRGLPLKRAGLGENAPAAAVAPVLWARHSHAGTMGLVPAKRVTSRIDARIGAAPQLVAASDAQHRVKPPASRGTARVPKLERRTERRTETRIATQIDTQIGTPTANAGALPVAAVTPHRPASPAPVIEPAPTRDATASTNVRGAGALPPVGRTRDDERGIYQVLQQYERAYERLDVNAARAVWPSLNTRALARAFDGLKEQALEFSHCRVALESREATAICGGRASYVPRVGHQTARTEPREWTFHLRKVDQEWLIARTEVK
jgi:CheY-like chemotaxis protein